MENMSSSICTVMGQCTVAGHILLYSPIQFKVVLVVKMFWDLLPSFLTFKASKGLKLSFTSEIVC